MPSYRVLPLVSVVIPCYRQAHFLAEAIESVLRQSYPHFEIIVVDDGLPDDAAEVAARYPAVRCVRQENCGLPAARNAGFRESKGDYLVFLDSDDRLLPNALATGVRALNDHPRSGYVAGQHVFIDSGGLATGQGAFYVCVTPEAEHYYQLLRFQHSWTPLDVMVRRTAFERAGGFRTSPGIKGCEDYDLCLRIAAEQPAFCHNQVIAEYRLHSGGISSNKAMIWRSSLNVLRSQRKAIRRDPVARAAYREGMRYLRQIFAEDVIYWEIRSAAWRGGEWGRVANAAATVLLCSPWAFVTYGYRKLRRKLKATKGR